MSYFRNLYSDEALSRWIDDWIESYQRKETELDGALQTHLSEKDQDDLSFLVRQRALWGRMFGQVISIQYFGEFALYPLPPGWVAFQKPSKPYPQSYALDELDEWVSQLLDRMGRSVNRARLERRCRCPFFWVRWAIYYAHGAVPYGVDAFMHSKRERSERVLRSSLCDISKNIKAAVELLEDARDIVDRRKIDLIHFLPKKDEPDVSVYVDTLRYDDRIQENRYMFEDKLRFKQSDVFDLNNIKKHLAFFEALEEHCDRLLERSSDKGGADPVWRRHAFAAHMAAAYFFLTGKRPTSSPTGDFDKFLLAAERVYWDMRNPASRYPEKEGRLKDDLPTVDIVSKAAKTFMTVHEENNFGKIDITNRKSCYEELILPATLDELYKTL